MAVTNLTNTTWYFDARQIPEQYIQFNINFSSNGQSFVTLRNEADRFNGWTIYYDNTRVYTHINGWVQGYQEISITGGSDVESLDLIQWLDNIGTQLKVDNLTDTTWTVASGWEVVAGYGQFSINGKYIVTNYTNPEERDFALLEFGYRTLDDGASANRITIDKNYGYFTTDSFIFNFSSGDTTNPKLIAWLSKYGELQGSEPEPEQPEEPTEPEEPETSPITYIPHLDYPYDFKNQFVSANIFNEAFAPSNFVLTIEGYVNIPTLFINNHKYSVNVTVGDGERLVIDSVNKTITLIRQNEEINCFNDRCKDSYIFEKIPSGWCVVTSPSGNIRCTLTLLEERSEPKWT